MKYVDGSLFAIDEQSSFNAWVAKPRDENYHFYSRGYFEAANKLFVSLKAEYERGGFKDYVIFPLVFLYRHAIELELKYLLIKLPLLVDLNSKFKQGHDILTLWKNVLIYLTKLEGFDDSNSECLRLINLIMIDF